MSIKINTKIFKKKLEVELDILTKELKDLGIQNPLAKDDWIPVPEKLTSQESDSNIVADRSEDWNEKRGTLDALETRFNNINRALKKIAGETFGICEIGKETIDLDRLEVNPSARTCKKHMSDESSLSR